MLFVILGIQLILLIGGVYVVKNQRNDSQRIEVFEDFFTETEGQASPLAQLIGQAGAAAAVQVSEAVNGQLAGAIGGTMKGATNELEKQAIADNPALAIMDGMPKAIKKNPLAYMAMQALINRNLPAGGGGALTTGGNHEQVKFNL